MPPSRAAKVAAKSPKRVTFGVPHMEWDAEKEAFERIAPRPPPKMQVKARLMEEVHSKYGVKCQSNGPMMVSAVTDTGCQTSSAGVNMLRKMGIPERYLIPTCHRIIGITDTNLKILGAVFLEIECNDRVTRQMVHISTNSSGLYLSEQALIELGLIDPDFPNCKKGASCSAAQVDPTTDEETCKCIPRKDAPEKPMEMPYPPTEENVEKIQAWLIDNFKSSAFNTCTHQPLNVMSGAPMKIVFKEDYTEHRVHTPIEVPHYWKYKVKEDIDMDVRLGIIEPVPQGTPTTWCTRMVVTAKKNGKPRRTVDLQKLKEATLRETHFTPTPFSIVSVTPSDTYKTVLDAWNGYHSLPLAENARDPTTFITEWGRYRYKRAPQGFHASGDAYTRRFDDITAKFKRVSRCVDDSLLWDSTIEDAFWHTHDYLNHCSKNGIIFNQEKFVFAKKTCEFAGFELTPDGYRPPARMLDAIQNFPTPKNVHDIRSWFGLVNQVAYAFAQSQTMAPFRDHLKDQKFYWDESLDIIFKESKIKIVNLIKEGVRNFEVNRPTCLATDWSKSGVGFTLSQKYCECPKSTETKAYSPNCGNGHWKLVLAGSRFTKPAESRYAPVEGEALAVAYGLAQCRLFILGSPDLVVAVDHKPLIRILNDRALEDIENPRILRLKEKTLPYNFKIIHVPGILNSAPDAMSRHPTNVDDQNSSIAAVEEEFSRAFAIMQSDSMPGSVTWETIDDASAHDAECIKLREAVEHGFPQSRNELPQTIRKYFQMKDDLYTIGRTVFKGKKMLIPASLRQVVLDGLHAAHQGVTGMRSNARERLFWPGLDADLKLTRDQCRKCNENAPSQSDEPMIHTEIPELPFQQVAIDYCSSEGTDYLIYADRFSGWTEVAKVQSTAFPTFQKNVLIWFRTYGVPEEISSDGGPPFNSSDFKLFLKKWNITHRLSSAYYAQSNGRAEVAVKTMKRCLSGNTDRSGSVDNEKVSKAVMTHRNTPNHETGISPAEMLFGYKLRDHLPNKFRTVRKEWSDAQKARELRNAMVGEKMQTSESAKRLPALNVGDCVSIQNQTGNRPKKWSNTGTIVEVLPHRQYKVVVDGSRRITLRNRKFLRKTSPITCVTTYPDSVVSQSTDTQHTANDTARDKEPLTSLAPSPPCSPAQAPSSPTVNRTPNVVQAQVPMPTPLEVDEAPNMPLIEDQHGSPQRPHRSTTQNIAGGVPRRGKRALANLRDYNNPGSAELLVLPTAPPPPPAVTQTARRKAPRALSNLRDYNNPGDAETPRATGVEQVSGTRRSLRAKKPPDFLMK